MQDFNIDVGAEEDARRKAMLEDYQACLDAQWAAESAREQRCESFLEPLMAAAAAIRRRLLDVQLVVQHGMLLAPSTDIQEAQVHPHALSQHCHMSEFCVFYEDSTRFFRVGNNDLA
jgi:hypothetical protein